MKKTHYIYRITHLPTGRFYIGKRSCKGAWQDDRYMGSGKVMTRLLKKYPLDQFKKEVLCLCRDAAQALHAERAAIGTQWRDNPLCINLCEGGGGVAGYFDLPENREAQSARRKKYFEDPSQREAHAERVKRVWANPAQHEKMSDAQKKAWADPALRAAMSDAQKKRFEDPSARAAQSERAKKRYEDPAQREAAAEQAKKRFEDPENREAMSAAKINDTVRLSKDGVIYAVSKEQLLTELAAGAVFCGNTTKIHHPAEGVWFSVNSNTAKHLLLLGVGWEFGRRSLLEQITMKRVDKATGRVLPA